jgi:photosystem II stability/assembly factor-like uncharacterized protein
MALGLLTIAAPAAAEWTQVADIPTTQLFSVWANGDTIAAGADSVTYVSTDSGASWQRSSGPANGVTSIQAVWVRNGRLYAGTFGQGVFVSDDLGQTWSAFNQGLVGGFANSQLFLVDFQVLGDRLYAATSGAGVYERDLAGAGTWAPFGDAFEPNQASNLNSLALGGTRLLASAGANGMVFDRDPGDADWTVSNLNNAGLQPGLTPFSAAWTGTGWVVGTNAGIFRSVAGQEPWTQLDLNLGTVLATSFATQGGHLFAAFDLLSAAVIEESDDDGATWQDAEIFPAVFVFKLAVGGTTLYAARADGLWRRPAGTVSVPGTSGPSRLRFAVVGPQPFRDQTRLRFDLPEAGTASIEVFDIFGRVAGDRVEGSFSAGPHEMPLDARRLSPGVYAARLTAGGSFAVVRLVHVR